MVMILQGEGIKNKPVDKWQTANLHIKSNLNKERISQRRESYSARRLNKRTPRDLVNNYCFFLVKYRQANTGRICTLGDILSNFRLFFSRFFLLWLSFSFLWLFFFFFNFQMLGYLHVLQARFVPVIMKTLVTKKITVMHFIFITYCLKTKHFIEWPSGQIIVPLEQKRCFSCVVHAFWSQTLGFQS